VDDSMTRREARGWRSRILEAGSPESSRMELEDPGGRAPGNSRMELGRAARPPRRCTASWLGCAGDLLWTTPWQHPRPLLPTIPALARGSTESRLRSSRRSVSSCPQLEALLHTDEIAYSHRVLFSVSCGECRSDDGGRDSTRSCSECLSSLNALNVSCSECLSVLNAHYLLSTLNACLNVS
jgi:hypothetical protein